LPPPTQIGKPRLRAGAQRRARIGVPLKATWKTCVAPIVREAVRNLGKRIGATKWTECVSCRARQDLARHLSNRLGVAFGPTLDAAFEAKLVAESITVPVGDRQNKCRLREGEAVFAELASTFGAFRESVALMVEDWIASNCELVIRFDRDRNELKEFLDGPQPFSKIEKLDLGLSDCHEEGRSVALLAFAGDGHVVYKPRPPSGELVWHQLLEWLSRDGFRPVFWHPRLLARNEFHWMESVPYRTCFSLAEVRRFYFRWGAQAAMAHIVGLADLHHENWIASGEHPVLVDAEAFGQDAWKLERRNDFRDSDLPPLLGTGLLPLSVNDGVGRYEGIAPFDSSVSITHTPQAWPRRGNKSQPPSRHCREIVLGFETVVSFIFERRYRVDYLTSLIRSSRAKLHNRVFVRSTSEYYRLLRASLQPYFLLSQETRRTYLLQECMREAPRPAIADAEADALVRNSVPRFYARDLGRPIAKFTFPSYAEMLCATVLLRTRLSCPKSDSCTHTSRRHRQMRPREGLL
jgi:Domain of unknown function (DUF4135)